MKPTLVIFLALTAALPGCTGKADPEAVVGAAAGAVHEGTLAWKSQTDAAVSLASTGVVDVDLEAFAGDVTITTDPAAKASVVQIRRVGTHGWGRESEAMDSLGELRYAVTLERRQGVDTVVVRGGTDHAEPHFQRLEVEIVVPDLGAVRVQTSRGDVWVENNRGPIEVVTTRGAIRVMTPWKMDGPITLITSDGNVDLRLRGESSGAIDAETVGGTIKTKIKYGEWIATYGGNDEDTLRASFNRGTNPVTLRTSNGNIVITVVPDPVSNSPFPTVW
jgi:hypothetical protein